MNIRIVKIAASMFFAAMLIWGCKVSYNMSGGSVSPDAKTFSVPFINNTATMVAPILSPTITDALQNKLSRQTKLTQVREDGDLNFEAEITNYTSTPTAVTAQEVASKNRLTITVKVKFTNKIQPEFNFDGSFTQYLDYDSNKLLTDVEGTLIPDIVNMIVDDIFNAAVSNW